MSRFVESGQFANRARASRHRPRASLAAFLALSVTLSTGCKDAASPPDAASGIQAAIEETSKAALAVDAAPASDALQPGQRLQGTIVVDVGDGPKTYRVIATKLADDLGKQAAERLASVDGKAVLDKANTRVGGTLKVGASDVQELADAFAGKTMYSAQVRTIEIVKRQHVSIEGEAADGSRLTLGISLPIAGDEVLDASLEYQPDRKRVVERFEAKSGKGGDVRIVLERLQRDDAQTWSVAGTFDAANLQPGVLAKKLAGRSIGHASGRFDVAELHVREP